MSRYVRIVLILALILIVVPVLPVSAASTSLPDGCQWVNLQHGAIGYVCLPIESAGVPWNGDLVIFAHGYVAPGGKPIIPEDQLVLGGLPGSVTSRGFAFAVTSYRTNGLAIKDGVADLVELRQAFIKYITKETKNKDYTPLHTYVVGVSEGGLVTTLAIEQRPDIFSGGLACCGPVGDFQKQMNYWGDFRVVFDYFFPGILTSFGGDAMNVPQSLIDAWVSEAVPQAVGVALANNPLATMQLLSVTQVPTLGTSETILQTVIGILSYNILATNDGIKTLKGNPFDNTTTQYIGSFDDEALNAGVARFKASQKALDSIAASYQTTGQLARPLVTMHTTLDPIVPYMHEDLYALKIVANGSQDNYFNIPIIGYGHCNFTIDELVGGVGRLVYMVTGSSLVP